MKLLTVLSIAVLLSLPMAASAQEVAVPVSKAASPATATRVEDDPKGPVSGEAYATPTSKDLLQTLIMMQGDGVTDPVKVDDYARLMYCKLYQEKFKNDFEWNTIRSQITDRIKMRKEYYRKLYEIGGVIYLGRYNFETQDFPLVKRSSLFNVSSLVMLESAMASQSACFESYKNSFPTIFMAKLKQPLTVDRLKVPLDEAEKLLEKMGKAKNNDRRMYIRFRVRLNSLIAMPRANNKAPLEGNFMADVVAIDVFYDSEMKKYFSSVSLD